MSVRTFAISSVLAASPAAVWERVSSMRGVNEELGPWLHMSYPDDANGRRLSPEDTGRPLFTSTLSFLRVVPYDRHRIQLTRVVPEQGFLEESTSWTMRAWRHERTLEPHEGGTRLSDRLTFEPRLPGIGPVAERLVGAVFRHRHDMLRRRFGGRSG
jgi:hypothetical protein